MREGARVQVIGGGAMGGEMATVLKIDEEAWPGFALLRFDKEGQAKHFDSQWFEQECLEVIHDTDTK